MPTNRAEAGYFKLKLGNAALEWADVLYRSGEPDSIMRARELYKAWREKRASSIEDVAHDLLDPDLGDMVEEARHPDGQL